MRAEVQFPPSRVKQNWYLSHLSQAFSIIRTGQGLSIRIMWLNRIFIGSWWGSTIKSPWVSTATNRYRYYLICSQDVKLQQPTNHDVHAVFEVSTAATYDHDKCTMTLLSDVLMYWFLSELDADSTIWTEISHILSNGEPIPMAVEHKFVRLVRSVCAWMPSRTQPVGG